MRTAMYTLATFAAFATTGALPNAIGAQMDEQASRAKLDGSWVQSGGSAEWTISSSADGLHIQQNEGSNTVADFDCPTDGRDCEVKISGHKAKVSMYYNGAALVELETKGSEIVKRRFSLLPSGNNMKLEVTPMTGRVQTEELQFERGQPRAAQKAQN